MLNPLLRFESTPACLLVTCLLAGTSAQADQTVNWGSGFADNFIQSDGTDVDSSFTFELGCFDLAFADIEALPTNQWGIHWHPVDQTDLVSDALGMRFTDDVTITDTPLTSGLEAYDPDDPGNVYAIDCAVGDKMYIWVYDSLAGNPGDEWFIASGEDATDPNFFNLPNPIGGGTPLERWGLSGTDTPEYGASVAGEGAGDHTDTSTTGFNLRTHAVPVPEPTTASLSLMALSLLLLSRRR